jgi:hypothetical protein
MGSALFHRSNALIPNGTGDAGGERILPHAGARTDGRVAGVEVAQACLQLGAVGGPAEELVGEDLGTSGLVRARIWRSSSCEVVDTRAYPIRTPLTVAGSDARSVVGRRRIARGSAGVTSHLRLYEKRHP